MKKIDLHTHVRMRRTIRRQPTNRTYCTPEEMIEKYKELGVEKGVILARIGVEAGTDVQSNEAIIEVVEKYGDWFYWFANIHPQMGNNTPTADLSYFIEYYKQYGAKGVGELIYNQYFDDPRVENLFYHCQKTNMPVLFHMNSKFYGGYGLVDDLGLPRLEKELNKFPDLIFIGHSQPFWAEIGSDVNDENRDGYPTGKVYEGRIVELLQKYPNLYGDLSAGSGFNAVSRDEEFGCDFIEEFQDRLFFGMDIAEPEGNHGLSFWMDDMLKKGKISEKAYKKVGRENVIKLLGE